MSYYCTQRFALAAAPKLRQLSAENLLDPNPRPPPFLPARRRTRQTTPPFPPFTRYGAYITQEEMLPTLLSDYEG